MERRDTRMIYLSMLLFRWSNGTELLAVNMYGLSTVGHTKSFMMKSIDVSDFAPMGCIMLFHSKLAAENYKRKPDKVT